MDPDTGSKWINDAIHGYITLEPFLLQFVDTPQFQRLRDLAQLGTCYYVFPGATHRRFEHCIGTSHIASELITHLQRSQPSLGITEHDRLLVKTAALCHDLGHGPLSHVFDNEFIPRVMGRSFQWCHEDASVMMLNDIIDDRHLDIEPDDQKLIGELIHPDPKKGFAKQEKRFLYDVVSNSRNGVDVDKFDYLARDSYHIGFKHHFDHKRLIQFSRVIDDEICFNSKDVYNIYELFHTRYSLHKQIYSHRASKAIEYMLTDAMILAEPYMRIADKIHDPKEYVKLTDSVIKQIEFHEDPRYKPAQDIIARLRRRDIYKMAGEVVFKSNEQLRSMNITSQDICNCQEEGDLSADDIIVQTFNMDYSARMDNPVDSVHFFNTADHERKFSIRQHKVSFVIPDQFSESYIRVYCRHPSPDKMGAVRVAFERFLKRFCTPLSPTPASASKTYRTKQRTRQTEPLSLDI